jgi:hypothetical protein
VGIRFFKVVGVFSYIAAALSLLAAVGLAALASIQFTEKTDETKRKPQVSFEQYQEQVQSSQRNNTPAKEDDPAEVQPKPDNVADGVFQEKLGLVFNRIVTAIDEFAAANNQGSVNREGLQKYLIDNTAALNRDEYLDFLSALANEAEKLSAKKQQISEMAADDPNHIKWDKFLDWFISSYMQSYNEEQERIQAEKVKQEANKSEALSELAVSGAAFMVFVFFTMILLLVRIEANTRYSFESNPRS